MKSLPSVSLVVAPIVLAAAIVGLVILLGVHGDRHRVDESPSGSVMRFLAAAGSGNGDTACGYLSIAETRAVETAAGPHVPCSEAFFGADLALAGRNDLTDLARVHFSASQSGERVRVVATDGHESVDFTVAPATPSEIVQQSYQPPSSNWRITSGATALVRPVP